MPNMQIRVVQQSDPDPAEKNPGWYKVDDFLPEDAAAIRAGTLERYTVEIIRTDGQGEVTVLGDSLNHIGKPGMAGVYAHPWDLHYSATEMIRAAKDEMTGAAGLEIGDHVVIPGQRPDGAGRLFEVLAVPKDDEGFGLGMVTVRQIDAVEGTGDRSLLVSIVSKEIPPRVPIEGRNRGGISESFRKREGGGFLVYHGEYADMVAMPPSALGTAVWGCRSIDDIGDNTWAYGIDRDGAVRSHGRKYPNKGLTN
ncbi:hypothetical protein AB0465_18510 [Streptomyces griseoviridis]|uniref:hypothetical protein n=1 Tax=Streptomyces griseoviridis TaxID=45398 RepID=UPI003450E041